tara:strand:+ start:38 stop:1456 length:1419 start_codon:yes stop_codon:yes gene_type:complete
MATTIEQRPLYDTFPVGQDIIFSISNNNIVTSKLKVKLIAEVHISTDQPPNISSTNDIVGTFKTSPNNAGVGMFNFRPIIESFVNTDNIASEFSRFKAIPININKKPLPIHIIDKFSRNTNTIVYLAIVFTTEYLDNDPNSSTYLDIIKDTTDVSTGLFKAFNGYVKYTDEIIADYNKNFGFDTSIFQLGGNESRFLTNAPLTQYANINDYGTLPFMSTPKDATGDTTIDYFKIDMYRSSTLLGSIEVENKTGNGGWTSYSAKLDKQLMFFGCFPGNLLQWNSIFFSNFYTNNMTNYDVTAYNDSDDIISETISIFIKCPNTKGYEPIRLAWLNQWGTWDYYTFNMKSSKSISTKGSTYQQLEGNWNERLYRLDSHKGGKKSFRVNATEKISMNTDFVSEDESEWFEELINSPEIYKLEGYQNDTSNSTLNKYVTPVRLLTSNYTRKTVANDKLMQYTFEIEKTKTLRTQSV